MTKRKEFSRVNRRKFLGFLSGTSLAFLPALKVLRAETALEIPKRAFFLVQTNGGSLGAFSPVHSGDSFELSTVLSALEPYKEHCSIFDRLFVSDGVRYGQSHLRQLHGVLTGQHLQDLKNTQGYDFYPLGPSLDQVVAELQDTRVLNQGEQSSNTYNLVSWLDQGSPSVPMPPEFGFDNIFGGISDLDDVDAAQQQAYLEQLRAEKKSVVDHLYTEFESIQAHLSASERAKLELHMEGVREIEKAVEELALPECSLPERGPFEGHHPSVDFEATANAYLDLAFAAMQCGLANVSTVLPCGAGSWGPRFSFLGYNDNNHAISHRDRAEHESHMAGIQAWYIQLFASFVERLVSTPEGDGTMLDNTICMYTTEMGNGGVHDYVDLQTVLCGNAGGYFRSGQYLDLEASNTGVLSAISEAMGGPEVFGDPAFAVPAFEALKA